MALSPVRPLEESDLDGVVDEMFGADESFGRVGHGGGGHHGGGGRGRFHRPARFARGLRGKGRWAHRGPWFAPYWSWGYPGWWWRVRRVQVDGDQIGESVADEMFDPTGDPDEEFGYGEASLEAKLGPFLLRRNLAGLRPERIREPWRFGADEVPWRKAVLIASSGRNQEARKVFEEAYPKLAHQRRLPPGAPPERFQLMPPYAVILGLGDGIRIDPARAERKLLEIYPELR